MLNKSKVVVFLGATNLDTSQYFYETVLGFKFISKDDTAIIFELNSAMLRITEIAEFEARDFTALGWIVDDINKTVENLISKGVDIERFMFIEQDDLGIWDTGDSKIAYIKDPDNNLLSFTQML